VRLDATELAKLLKILEKIDSGHGCPRLPDRIGRFLRQYHQGRTELDRVLRNNRIERRADAAVSGCALGPIEVLRILQPEASLLNFPLGEVAATLGVSEQLGGLANLVMWLKAPVANSTYSLLLAHPVVRLTGDYRWTPPARLTPGEAAVESSQDEITWWRARCLKAVADDLIRPPHALEYVLDYRMGPASLKYFRCICAVKHSDNFEVMPGLARSKTLDVATVLPEVRFDGDKLYALLIYCEPWSRPWTIVAAVPISAADALAHAITWGDFQRELAGLDSDPAIVRGCRDALRASGCAPTNFGQPNLVRSLLAVPREALRWLRGSA
jgi:hypothetical protein